MRAGILSSLQPFLVNQDSFSTALIHILKRMLQRADYDDLINVLKGAQQFIHEMEPFLNADADASKDDETTADAGTNDSSGGESDQQGHPDWYDEIRQVNLDEISDPDIRHEILKAGQDISNRHEAPLAGDESDNGAESSEEISAIR